MGKKKKNEKQDVAVDENVSKLSETMPGENGQKDGPPEVELEPNDRESLYDVFRRMRQRQGAIANVDRQMRSLDADYRSKRDQLEQAHGEHLDVLDSIDQEKQQRFEVMQRYYGLEDTPSSYLFDEETGKLVRQDVFQEKTQARRFEASKDSE